MFTWKDIKRRARKQPFVPFRIVTSSGETYVVTHPELIMVGAREVNVGSASQDDPSTFDDLDRIAIVHITALEDLYDVNKKKSKAR